MKKHALQPASGIIRRLGGEEAVAKRTQTSPAQPYKWQYDRARGGTGGLIPQKHHPTLLAMAKEIGVDLSANDFLPVFNEPRTPSSGDRADRAEASSDDPTSETLKSPSAVAARAGAVPRRRKASGVPA